MIIITDTREQLPFPFTKWPEVEIHRAALDAGDYSLLGFEDRAAIERKSLDDLVACLMGDNRTRFEKELARARRYDLFVVVVEAGLENVARGNYKSQMNPQAALQSVTALFVRYAVPFMFCGNRDGAEYMTYSLLSKYLYEIEKRYKTARKAQNAA
jgi:ERCC4-type nuclease